MEQSSSGLLPLNGVPGAASQPFGYSPPLDPEHISGGVMNFNKSAHAHREYSLPRRPAYVVRLTNASYSMQL